VIIIIYFWLMAVSLLIFSPWIHRNRNRSKYYWFAERIRSCLAYDGDPGPWKGREPVSLFASVTEDKNGFRNFMCRNPKCGHVLGRHKDGVLYFQGCYVTQRVTIFCTECDHFREWRSSVTRKETESCQK